MINLGGLLLLTGRPAEAVTQLQQAVALNRKLDNLSGLAMALLNLGAAYVDLADAHRSLEFARKAIAPLQESLIISHQLRSARAEADAAHNLGKALCRLNVIELGIECLREALAFYESSGQDDRAALTRRELHHAYRAAGNRSS